MTLVQRRESDGYLAEKDQLVGGTVISGEEGKEGNETKEEGGGAATPKRAKGKSKASGGRSGRRRLTLRGLGGSNKKEKKKGEESSSASAFSARSAKEQLASLPPPPPPPDCDDGDDPAMRPSPTTDREAYLRQSREHHHHHRPRRSGAEGGAGGGSDRARVFQRPPPMSTRATSGGSGSAVPPPQGFPVRGGPSEEGNRAVPAGTVVRPAPPLAAPAPPPVSSAMADAMDLEAEMAQYRRQSRAAPPAAPPPASPRRSRAAQGGPLPSPYPAEDPRRRPAHTPGLPTSNARDDRPDMMRRPPALAPPDDAGNATTTDLTGMTDRGAEMARYLRQSRAHPAHAAAAALPTTTTAIPSSSPRSRFSAEETPRRSNSGKIVAAGEEEGELQGGVRSRGLALAAGNEVEGTPISAGVATAARNSPSTSEGAADAATAAAALVAAMTMGREPRARDALSGEELPSPRPSAADALGGVAEAHSDAAHSATSSDRDGLSRSGNSVTANLEVDELGETQQRHNRSDSKLPDSNHNSFTDLDDTRDHERTYRVSFAPQRNAVTSVKHIPIQHQPNVLFTLIDEANWTEVVLRAESAPHEVAQWVRPSASPSGEPIRLLALHAAAERWSRGGGMESAAGHAKRGGDDSADSSGQRGSENGSSGSQNRGSRGSHCVVRAFVSAFLAILRADPDAARYPDGDGRTLLHWAVDIHDDEDDGADSGSNSSGDGSEGMGRRRPPPEEVFDALFGVYPEAARVREHRYGCLPLHVACSSCGIGGGGNGNGRKRRGGGSGGGSGGSHLHRRSGAERRASVVRRLLKAFPEGALCRDSQRGWVPLHAAVRNGAPALVILELLRACPQAASVPDSDKRLPLHFAARYADNWDGGQGGGGGGGGELTRVLESLIDAYPESLKRREDKMGYTPLHTACSARHPQDVTDALLTAFLHRGPAGEVGVSPLVRAGSGGRPSAAAAKRTRALLSIPDYSQRLPLHVAAQSSQPFHVLRTLLLPNPTSAADQDRDGRIALHHAVSSRPCAPSSVSILLRAFPNGAKVVEGKRGWTPLHGAASSGGGCHKGVVAELLAHFPEGARTRDRSGALPLHLLCRPNYFAGGRAASTASSSSSGAAAAATMAKGSARSLATVDSVWSLEVADMLLHAYPEGSRVKDRKGRTPLDLLLVDGQEGGSGGNNDDEMWRKAMRAVLMDDTATLREV